MGGCGSMVVAGVVVFCFFLFFIFIFLILWCFSGSGGDGFGGFFMFFMFKICVKGKTDKFQFLILFILHFCSIFCFGRREI